MKSKLFIPFALLLLVATACESDLAGLQQKLKDKKGKLEKLQGEISELEQKIAALDTTVEKTEKGKLVSVQKLERAPFEHYLEVQAMVDAEENAFVQPQMPGLVTAVYVQEGDRVSKGQVLAQTDASVYLKALDEIKTGLALANTVYEKQKRLWDQNIGSEIQFLTAKSQKEQLEGRLKTTQEQIEMTKIKAPFSGTVDEVHVKVGEFASPGYFGVRVVNTAKLKVAGKMSDTYIGKVKRGAKTWIHFPDINKSIESSITFVGEAVNASSRTFGVEAQLGYDPLYKPNMLAKMKILDAVVDSAITVPANAIQNGTDGNFVFIAVENDNGKFVEKRKVTTGLSYDGKTEVTTGLQRGDLIITFGFTELSEGQRIDFEM